MIEGPCRAPVFATGDADAEKQFATLLSLGGAPVGVVIVGVAAVDDGVFRIEQRPQPVNLLIHHRAGGHHQHDGARRSHGGHQRLGTVAGQKIVAQATGLRHEAAGCFTRPVVDRHHESVFGHVERQIGTHRAEADQADVGTPVGVHGH